MPPVYGVPSAILFSIGGRGATTTYKKGGVAAPFCLA